MHLPFSPARKSLLIFGNEIISINWYEKEAANIDTLFLFRPTAAVVVKPFEIQKYQKRHVQMKLKQW